MVYGEMNSKLNANENEDQNELFYLKNLIVVNAFNHYIDKY